MTDVEDVKYVSSLISDASHSKYLINAQIV